MWGLAQWLERKAIFRLAVVMFLSFIFSEFFAAAAVACPTASSQHRVSCENWLHAHSVMPAVWRKHSYIFIHHSDNWWLFGEGKDTVIFHKFGGKCYYLR